MSERDRVIAMIGRILPHAGDPPDLEAGVAELGAELQRLRLRIDSQAAENRLLVDLMRRRLGEGAEGHSLEEHLSFMMEWKGTQWIINRLLCGECVEPLAECTCPNKEPLAQCAACRLEPTREQILLQLLAVSAVCQNAPNLIRLVLAPDTHPEVRERVLGDTADRLAELAAGLDTVLKAAGFRL